MFQYASLVKMNYSTISLDSKHEISPDSAVLRFVSSAEQHLEDFKAGQYLSFRLTLKGKQEIRPYSILEKISNNEFTIALKKVNKGLVSNYFINQLAIGEKLEASEPEGRFFILPKEQNRAQHFFISAGIGITPLYCMMQCLLEQEAKSEVYLLFGNRKKEDILFHKNFLEWLDKYAGQFFAKFSLTQSGSGFSLFKKNESWSGLKGRIDSTKIKDFLQEYRNEKLTAHFYICGPEQFNIEVEKILTLQGISATQIHKEFFFLEKPEQNSTTGSLSGKTILTVKLEGKTHQIEMPKGKLIVEELMRQKINPPYSCSSGACATCVAKLKKGEVKMDISMALDQSEIDKGYILTCQSRPQTDEVEIEY